MMPAQASPEAQSCPWRWGHPSDALLQLVEWLYYSSIPRSVKHDGSHVWKDW